MPCRFARVSGHGGDPPIVKKSIYMLDIAKNLRFPKEIAVPTGYPEKFLGMEKRGKRCGGGLTIVKALTVNREDPETNRGDRFRPDLPGHCIFRA